MISKMARIEIIGLKENLRDTVRELHELGTMQIDDIRTLSSVYMQPINLSYEMVQARERVDLVNAKINGLEDLFKKYFVTSPLDVADTSSFTLIDSKVEQVTTNVQQLIQQKNNLQDELISLSKYREILKIMVPLLPDSARKSGNATIGALLHTTQTRSMNMLINQLRAMTQGKFEMVTVKIGESTNALIGVLPRDLVVSVESYLEREKITQLVLPDEYTMLSSPEAQDKIEKKIENDHKELDAIDDLFRELASMWGPYLHSWQVTCQNIMDEFEIYSRIGETEHTFTIYGWIKRDEFNSLDHLLHEKVSADIMVNILEVPKELNEKVPVVLENPKVIKPFENLTKMRAIPAYFDIDPSELIAIFMPIFFGMMLGDIGYGAILLVLSFFLSKKMTKGIFADLIKTIFYGSIWAIIFGFLFGELFGTLGGSVGLKPILMDRSEPTSTMTLLYMVIGVGVFHIVLGLLIGLGNAIKHHNKTHILERGGMLIGLSGLLLLVGKAIHILPAGVAIPSYVLLVVGIGLLGASYGKTGIILGPIEFVGLLGSILSYLRIAALGLASVFLAKVANDMVGMMGNVVVGVFVAVLIHSLNLIMGAFSPTIQSLRLQYVEFFRRFYEGGSNEFMPFKKRVLSLNKD
ncbi:MAG: V-type ATP synthase subunit I [Anaerolineaceae bacterium]